MKTLDLDDLPPRLAQMLTSLEAGEDLVLVQNGVVVSRLTGLEAPVAEAPEPPPSQERAAEIFEQFRSLMEDEF
jgi:antitoxin (DNA-binding transcriptional repressor) of toxin-antitoxin stability system